MKPRIGYCCGFLAMSLFLTLGDARSEPAACVSSAEAQIFHSADRVGKPVPVRGFFLPADRDAEAPVVIMLPTSLGIEPPDCYAEKQREFRERGYASVVIDSHNETGLAGGRRFQRAPARR